MGKKVIIVHGSAIVRAGIADILRKTFKCSIESYSETQSLIGSVDSLSGSVLFVEDALAEDQQYQKIIGRISKEKVFHIVDSVRNDAPTINGLNSILLNSTTDDIYEKVKQAFSQQEVEKQETEGLSNREIEILKLVAHGHANKIIADKLCISTHTVMSHRKNLTEKLGIKSISGLTVYAIINNHIDMTGLNTNDLI